MLVIAKDAEQQFLKEAQQCREHFPNHRCLFLRFSKLSSDRADNFSLLMDELRASLDDSSSQVYLCTDGDVFILNRYLTHKRVQKILAHLAPNLQPALPHEELADLFEIGIDWHRIRNLCEKKISRLQTIVYENHKPEKDFLSPQDALNHIDKGLIQSLPERRSVRDQTEIMVVEDDAFSQRLLNHVLKDKYPVSMTSDGAGALLSYVKKAPDVLFLDIGLPDIDGHEVLKKVFEMDPDAYVVMFSGNGDKNNVRIAQIKKF